MPRYSLAYDYGRYAFMAGKPANANPYRTGTIHEALDWQAGYEREAADMVHYQDSICIAVR